MTADISHHIIVTSSSLSMTVVIWKLYIIRFFLIISWAFFDDANRSQQGCICRDGTEEPIGFWASWLWIGDVALLPVLNRLIKLRSSEADHTIFQLLGCFAQYCNLKQERLFFWVGLLHSSFIHDLLFSHDFKIRSQIWCDPFVCGLIVWSRHMTIHF